MGCLLCLCAARGTWSSAAPAHTGTQTLPTSWIPAKMMPHIFTSVYFIAHRQELHFDYTLWPLLATANAGMLVPLCSVLHSTLTVKLLLCRFAVDKLRYQWHPGQADSNQSHPHVLIGSLVEADAQVNDLYT